MKKEKTKKKKGAKQMKRTVLIKVIRYIILINFIFQGVLYAYQWWDGKKGWFEVLPSFFITLVLLFLFLLRTERSYVWIQGMLGVAVIVEILMLITLLVGMVMICRLGELQVNEANLDLLRSLGFSISWKSLLVIGCFKCPELIRPN